MGVWEWMSSTGESVKRYTPDAWTPLKNGCKASYGYGSAAFTKVQQLTPDEESRSKMGLFTTKFAKNAGFYALQEGYKIIPGGAAFSKILSKTLNDVKHEQLIDEKVNKALKEKLYTPKEHTSGGLNLTQQAQMHSRGAVGSTSHANLIADVKPDDVIRVFMMKEFIGHRFLDDLMVPRISRGKNPEQKAAAK